MVTDSFTTNAACKVKLFRHFRNTWSQTVYPNGKTEFNNYDQLLSDSLISCSINRTLDAASSTWSLVATATANWMDILLPGDWIVIFLGDKSEIDVNAKKGIKEIGQIDRVAKNKIVTNDGSIQTTFQIAGRGIGKIFEDTTLFFNPYITPDFQKELYKTTGVAIKGRPDIFIKSYIELFLGKAQQPGSPVHNIAVPAALFTYMTGERAQNPVGQLAGIIGKRYYKTLGWSYARDLPTSGLISLWDVLKRASNEPFNEMFFDVRGGKPTITMRPVPMSGGSSMQYDSQKQKAADLITKNGGDWTFHMGDLYQFAIHNFVTVPAQYIIQENLGYAMHEMYNYLIVYADNFLGPEQTQMAAAANKLPIIDRQSVRDFGLRRLELTTEYAMIQAGKEQSQTDWNAVYSLARKIAPYLFVKHRFQNGTFTVEGMNNFQLGDFVKVINRAEDVNAKEQQKFFKVEGIQYQWDYLQPIQTTLSVTHGFSVSGKFLDDKSNWAEDYRSTFIRTGKI